MRELDGFLELLELLLNLPSINYVELLAACDITNFFTHTEDVPILNFVSSDWPFSYLLEPNVLERPVAIKILVLDTAVGWFCEVKIEACNFGEPKELVFEGLRGF